MQPLRLLPLICALVLPAWAGRDVAAAPEGAARLYQDYCSVCHGDRGDGRSRASAGMNPPPRDFTTPQAAVELTRERMLASVTEGVPGTAMSGWQTQLSDDQIAAIVDYVREHFMRPATTAEANEGRRIYAEYCSVCHGDQGNGRSRASGSMNPPPRDFTAAAARRELTRERMLFSVEHGRANTAMAAWGTQLDDAQIAAVVDYVRTAFMGLDDGGTEEVAEAPAHGHDAGGHVHAGGEADLTAPLPDGLVGDPAWGETFYNANCAVCHGESGDGQGPRAFFINPKPRDFRHPAARASLNRPHLYEAIAHGKLGTEMPAWRQVLSAQQMANVAEYVFRAFIAGDPDPDGHDAHPEQGAGDHRQPHGTGDRAH